MEKRAAALRRTLSAMALVPMLSWASGAAAANQQTAVATNAQGIVNAALANAGVNANTLTQLQLSGPANQTAAHVGDADALNNANAIFDASNAVAIGQVAPGSALGNQGATLGANALAILTLGIGSNAQNNSFMGQFALGPGSINQNAASALLAGSLINSTAGTQSFNQLGLNQIMGATAMGNQNAGVTANAINASAQLAASNASNGNSMQMFGLGGGSANQDQTSASLAQNVIGLLQNTLSFNTLGLNQVMGNGQANQTATPSLVSFGTAVQGATGNATNANALTAVAANAAGMGANQDQDNTSASLLAMFGTQINVGANQAALLQSAGNGQGNQNMPILGVALANAQQGMSGNAGNLNVLTAAAGAGNTNQDQMNLALAQAELNALQGNAASNTVLATQANGNGQGNQTMPAQLAADAAAAQGIAGNVFNVNALTALGGAANSNQAQSNAAAALGAATGIQENNATNLFIGTQVNAGNQANQAMPVAAVADSDASQAVGITAANLNTLLAANGGAGSANQTQENATQAQGQAMGSQVLVGTNAVFGTQVNAAGQASQFMPINALADANGQQTVGAAAGNSNTLIALAPAAGMVNQAQDNTSDADAAAGAFQGVGAVNTVVGTQASGVTNGAAAQSLQVTPTAVANAAQNVGAAAGNSNTLFADPASANQSQTNDTDADALALGNQEVNAQNTVVGTQQATGNSAAVAQFGMITPTAVATGVQNAGAASGNTNSLTAIGNGGPNAQNNQNQDSASAAGAVTDADQDIDAGNTVTLTQLGSATNGALAQAANIAPTAVATGVQNADSTATNNNSLTAVGGAGQNNQDATNSTAAGASTEADQTIAANNNIGLTQTGNVNNGAVAQFAEIAPTTVAQGSQDASANAANNNGIAQLGGAGQGNQDVDNSAAAGAAVDADQDLSATQNGQYAQTCTAVNTACAQFLRADGTTVTAGAMNVDADAVNNTGIVQAMGNAQQANQDATNTVSAGTAVNAGQDLDSTTNTNAAQTSVGGPANQALDLGNDTATVGAMNIDADSGNTTGIAQLGSGPMSNQNAANTGAANTLINALSNLGSSNTTNATQTSVGGPANQQAASNNTATTASTTNITGSSNNTTNIVQQ